MCILVVEDDATLGRAFVMQMSKLGYMAHLAATAAEAIEKFGKQGYDLVFMDVGLPDEDGLGLTEKLRTIKAKGELPIVGITAGYATREQCLKSGMDDYFQKPVLYDQLREIIQRFDPKNCKEC
jgi:CheY-like chemotaxis protein